MLIATGAVLAMRCPKCGKMDVHNFSRFAFPVGEAVFFRCSCEAPKLEVVKTRSGYVLELFCVVCETRHRFEFSGRNLWSGEIINLSCPETGLDLGSIGPPAKIGEVVLGHKKELEILFGEFGCDSYFHNPGIMYQVLVCLHHIADRGGLYCQCGNYRIDVELFPDRLELHCRDCDSINIIYAETEEDLKVIQQVEFIELARNGFKFLDSLASTGKLKKSRRGRNKT